MGVVREKKSKNWDNGGSSEVVQLSALRKGKNGEAKWEAGKVGRKKRNKNKNDGRKVMGACPHDVGEIGDR